MSKNIDIVQIVARSKNNVIGNNGDLPWRLKEDLKFFKKNTMGHVCIVGRKTYDTIKHLTGRKFIVLTRNLEPGRGYIYVDDNGVIFTNDLDSAISSGKIATHTSGKSRLFIIGGGEIYRLTMPYANKLLVTEVNKDVEGDATYDFDNNAFKEVSRNETITENDISYNFVEYNRVTP